MHSKLYSSCPVHKWDTGLWWMVWWLRTSRYLCIEFSSSRQHRGLCTHTSRRQALDSVLSAGPRAAAQTKNGATAKQGTYSSNQGQLDSWGEQIRSTHHPCRNVATFACTLPLGGNANGYGNQRMVMLPNWEIILIYKKNTKRNSLNVKRNLLNHGMGRESHQDLLSISSLGV